MDLTSRMVALLGKMRRERNGAVADSMELRGCASGLNYGVSLPTVRKIARGEEADHEFARMLWQQDVRELRLAALHLADASKVEAEEEFWAGGIADGEAAEEAAFALLSRMEGFGPLFGKWCASEKPLLRYAALLGAARSGEVTPDWIPAALEAVHAPASGLDAHLVAQGGVAMLAAVAESGEEAKAEVARVVRGLGDTPSDDLLREELLWRLEY